MNYFRGTLEQCKAYNDLVYNELFADDIGTTNWMTPVEIDGDFYIKLHPDFPAPEGCEVVEELPNDWYQDDA